jgi:hypothetical protein
LVHVHGCYLKGLSSLPKPGQLPNNTHAADGPPLMGAVGQFHVAVMLMLVSRRFTALGACVEEAL